MRKENKGTRFNKSFVDKSKISENREEEKVWRNEKPFQNKNTGGKEAENRVEPRPRCWRCGMLGHVSAGCKKLLSPKIPGNGSVQKVNLMTECEEEVDEQNSEAVENEQCPENESDENVGTIYRICGADTETELILENIQNNNRKQMTGGSPDNVSLPRTNELKVDFGFGPIDAIFDSGASITVVDSGYVPDEFLKRTDGSANITLQTALGQETSAVLVNLSGKLIEDGEENYKNPVLLTCALVPNLKGRRCFLSMTDFKIVKQAERDSDKFVEEEFEGIT